MYNGTIISLTFIITLLSHLSHTYDIFQFFLHLIIKHYPYDNIIYIITFITIIHIIIVSIPVFNRKKSILSSTVMLTYQTKQIPSIALSTGPREGIKRGPMSRAFGQIRAHPRPRHS